MNWLGPIYSELKQFLDEIHRREGIDVFVATFSSDQNADGEMVNYCVWEEGVDALVPATQKVAFMQAGREGPVALANWSRVVEVVGDLMEATEYYPTHLRPGERWVANPLKGMSRTSTSCSIRSAPTERGMA